MRRQVTMVNGVPHGVVVAVAMAAAALGFCAGMLFQREYAKPPTLLQQIDELDRELANRMRERQRQQQP